MLMPAIFGHLRRSLHFAPHLLLAAVVADKHGQQLADVHAVGLGSPSSTWDLDAGRVHHQVLEALGSQVAVDPEAIATSFVAAQDASVLWKMKAFFGQADFLSQGEEITCVDAALAGLLAQANRKAQLPFLVAQLESYVQCW